MDCAPANSPSAGAYRPRKPRASPLYQCVDRHIGDLRAEGRLQRLTEEKVIARFLKCGDPHHGFARVYCPQCRHDYLLAFSCKARYFCPSCHQKRVLAYGDWVESNVLAPVPHRQYVFTVPRIVRAIFARRRRLLGALCQIVEKLLREAYIAAKPGGREGLILFVQTFGDLVTFNPHIHVLAADGVFAEDGTFFVLPPDGNGWHSTCCGRHFPWRK
ncbi:MAG: transposase zinc-binding domain-containing protein [Burkholderiales bacterium]